MMNLKIQLRFTNNHWPACNFYPNPHPVMPPVGTFRSLVLFGRSCLSIEHFHHQQQSNATSLFSLQPSDIDTHRMQPNERLWLIEQNCLQINSWSCYKTNIYPIVFTVATMRTTPWSCKSRMRKNSHNSRSQSGSSKFAPCLSNNPQSSRSLFLELNW